MKCEVCHGACCEEMAILVSDLPTSPDVLRWVKLHGDGTSPAEAVRFDLPCSKLVEGACSIYADRPQLCHDFERGGEWCLDAVRRRRSAFAYRYIRDDIDPETIHGG